MKMPSSCPLPLAASLPDDVVLSVRNVSKKFCRNLRRPVRRSLGEGGSMWYGMQDLGRNLLGIRAGRGDQRPQTIDHSPETIDRRLETIDHRPGVAETENPQSSIPQSNVYGLPSVALAKEGLRSKVPSPVVRSPSSVVSHHPPLRRDEFCALQDINFDLKCGQALDLIERTV